MSDKNEVQKTNTNKSDQHREIGLFGYMYWLENYYYETANEDVKRELYDINETLEKIAEDKNISETDNKILSNLKNYYLPAICKILKEYKQIQKTLPNTETEANFENEVKSFLSQMKNSFNKQLNDMYSGNIQDMKLEMNYIRTLLRSDGFFDDGFGANR